MLFTIFLLSQGLTLCLSQLPIQNKPSFQFLYDVRDEPTSFQGTTLNQPQPFFPSSYKQARKICIKGMWAIYSQPNYGISSVGSTLVTPIVGRSRIDCTPIPVGSYFLENCESIKPLGVGIVGDLDLHQVECYPHKYFLTNAEKDVRTHYPGSTIPNPETIKSFVMTGRTGQWIVCNTTSPTVETCSCLDVANGMFLAPDLNSWPEEKPLYQIRYFRDAQIARINCESFYQPLGYCVGGAPSPTQ